MHLFGVYSFAVSSVTVFVLALCRGARFKFTQISKFVQCSDLVYIHSFKRSWKDMETGSQKVMGF